MRRSNRDQPAPPCTRIRLSDAAPASGLFLLGICAFVVCAYLVAPGWTPTRMIVAEFLPRTVGWRTVALGALLSLTGGACLGLVGASLHNAFMTGD